MNREVCPMQLSTGERSILASFPDEISARSASNDLVHAGYRDTQISSLLANSSRRSSSRTSLSALTLGISSQDLNYGSLFSAHPQASGLSSWNDSGGSVLLVSVVPESDYQHAVQLIRTYGGII